jgi:hypothetical protein
VNTGVPTHITEDAETASTPFKSTGKCYIINIRWHAIRYRAWSLTFFSSMTVEVYLRTFVMS